MIHLGVIPYAVMVTPILLSPHQREQFINHGVKLLEVTQYDVDLALVQQAQPEIIVATV